MERRNLMYSVVLGILCVCIMMMVVLLLRRRSMQQGIPFFEGSSLIQSGSPSSRQAPPFRPLDSYETQAPWKEGDVIPSADNPWSGGVSSGSEDGI